MHFFNQKELGNPKQLGTYPINDNCYFIITQEMLNKIVKCGLSKENDLHTYALIKSIVDNTEEHLFYGTGNYIASRILCNIPSALRSLKKLAKSNLIVKIGRDESSGAYVYTLPEYSSLYITDKDCE